ncbi:hypothetical protein DWB85_12475 [Seongchinamella sediminis]|uniref:Uncharacterized protein n=1 Tax=Seongchinamella sediminis TaxID=2283635 RepID=A0A3L7DW69_9GAMM|nr:hypothetical protein [Seongchinamella sediminis]RLQ21564.1 hypothetical protein DWB85_12475 [Seongchinamella sediminis]
MLAKPSERVPERLDVAAYTPHSKEIFSEIASLDEDQVLIVLAKIALGITDNDWSIIWNSLVERPEVVARLAQDLDQHSCNRMMRAQPCELVPDFLPEISPSLAVLKTYLHKYYDVEETDRVARIEEYIRKNEELEAHLTLATLLQPGFPDGLGLSLGKLESSGFISGLKSLPAPLPAEVLPLVWEEWVKRPVEQLAEVKEGLPDTLWRQLSTSCPDPAVPDYIHLLVLDAPLLWRYVSRNHRSLHSASRNKIKDYIAGSSDVYAAMSSLSIPTEDVPKALNYFLPAEAAIWDFIELRWDLVSPQEQSDFRTAIQESNYVQAQFMLYLADKGAGGDSYPLPRLGRDVENLVSQLFHLHSADQTRIAKTIFMDCPVKAGFSACEASMAPNKNAGQRDPYKGGEQSAFNYWCRRFPCDAGECLVNYEGKDDDELNAALPARYGIFGTYTIGSHFYTLVKRYWGYQKTVLHDQKNGAFIRPLA